METYYVYKCKYCGSTEKVSYTHPEGTDVEKLLYDILLADASMPFTNSMKVSVHNCYGDGSIYGIAHLVAISKK
jgi:hypothetical protein